VDVNDAFNIGPRFVEPSVDEDFLRHVETIITRELPACEIDRYDIARGDKAQTGFFGSARFNKNFILARHSRAHVAARLFREVEFAEDAARLGNQLA
jgi:hypothetical protein